MSDPDSFVALLAGGECRALLAQELWRHGEPADLVNVLFIRVAGRPWARFYFDAGAFRWQPAAPESISGGEPAFAFRLADLGARFGVVGQRVAQVAFSQPDRDRARLTIRFERGTLVLDDAEGRSRLAFALAPGAPAAGEPPSGASPSGESPLVPVAGPPPLHPLVRDAVERLYAAFARPAPGALEACDCCTTAGEFDELLTTPLRALSAGQLHRYAEKAMSTVGDAADFRYFWPRIAELLATPAGPASDALVERESILGKVAYGRWREWPAGEQRATEAFAEALLLRMRDEELGYLADGWVCAVGRVLEDVTPALERALLAGTVAARRNLLDLVDANARSIEEDGMLANPFWSADELSAIRELLGDRIALPEGPRGMIASGERLRDWLLAPHVAEAVARARRALGESGAGGDGR